MSLLECKHLTKQYGTVCALDDLNLSLESGRIVGLLGPNGSGKTTLIKIANGLLQPTKGELLIDGMAPGPASRAICAYLPDRDYLPEYMTPDQLIRFYKDFFEDFEEERARAMLADLGLETGQKLKAMSKGTREKIQLIFTMSRRARIFFLDEPIAGVDPAARDYIIRTIISNYPPDGLVIISTHLIADIENVLDDVVLIKEGQIVLQGQADSIREARTQSIDQLFREVFKC